MMISRRSLLASPLAVPLLAAPTRTQVDLHGGAWRLNGKVLA